MDNKNTKTSSNWQRRQKKEENLLTLEDKKELEEWYAELNRMIEEAEKQGYEIYPENLRGSLIEKRAKEREKKLKKYKRSKILKKWMKKLGIKLN